jgi:rhodanese-related sulfurtransferase
MSYTSHDLLDAARRAIPEVSAEDVAARRTRGDEVIVLDVREKEEVRAGYIEGAITIPRGFLEFQAAAHLPQTDADIMVYCASGARSLLAAQVLRAMGYTHVASMAGGIMRWQAAGYGVGTVGIVDADVVERSNLQRQVLHTTDRVGMPKTASAALALHALNPDVQGCPGARVSRAAHGGQRYGALSGL